MGQDADLDRTSCPDGSPRLRSSRRSLGGSPGEVWWAWSTCTGVSSGCRAVFHPGEGGGNAASLRVVSGSVHSAVLALAVGP